MVRTLTAVLVLGLLVFPVASSAGSVWRPISLPPGADYCTALESGSGYLYAAARSSGDVPLGVFRTPLDLPGNWEFLGLSGRPIWDLLAAGPAGEILLAAAGGDTLLFRSTDRGTTWRSARGLAGSRAQALAWNGTIPGRMYCAVHGESSDAFAGSSDLGVSWSFVSDLGGQNYFEFLSVPRDGSAGVSMITYDGYWTSPVLRSTNGGASWQYLSPASWNGPGQDLDRSVVVSDRLYGLIGCTEIDRWTGTTADPIWFAPFSAAGLELPPWAPGTVFAAGVSSGGLLQASFRNEDGLEWEPMNDGFPSGAGAGPDQNWWKFQLLAASDAPLLFFSTWSRGLWMVDLGELAATQRPPVRDKGIFTSFAAPNPGAGTFTIALSPAYAPDARFEVLDAAGRLVRQLGAGEIRSGALRWDGRTDAGEHAPAGTYFVSYLSREGRESRKLVLVR
jgi:hypothetical protein